MECFDWENIDDVEERFHASKRYMAWCEDNLKSGTVIRCYFPNNRRGNSLHGVIGEIIDRDSPRVYLVRLFDHPDIRRLHVFEFRPATSALFALAMAKE